MEFAEHRAQGVTDFANRNVALDSLYKEGQERLLRIARRVHDATENVRRAFRVAAGAQRSQRGDLFALHSLVYVQCLLGEGSAARVAIDADYGLFAALDCAQIRVGGLLDFTLDEAVGYGLQRPPPSRRCAPGNFAPDSRSRR